MSDQVRNPLFARCYSRMMQREDPEQKEHRREMLSGLAGLGTLPGQEQKAVEKAAEKAEDLQDAVEEVVDQAIETGEANAAEAANGSGSGAKVGG